MRPSAIAVKISMPEAAGGLWSASDIAGPNPKNKVVNPFAVQCCEVEVNTKTGELRILRSCGPRQRPA